MNRSSNASSRLPDAIRWVMFFLAMGSLAEAGFDLIWLPRQAKAAAAEAEALAFSDSLIVETVGQASRAPSVLLDAHMLKSRRHSAIAILAFAFLVAMAAFWLGLQSKRAWGALTLFGLAVSAWRIYPGPSHLIQLPLLGSLGRMVGLVLIGIVWAKPMRAGPHHE